LEQNLLVHGDAPPVLLGLLLGKFHQINIGHVEAGCRSNNLLAPFPEELIRIIADRTSNVLFSLSEFASVNLRENYSKKYVFHTKRNTIYDAVNIAIEKQKEIIVDPFVLVSLHRFETLQSKQKMNIFIDLINKVSKTVRIIFPIHESTKKALEKFDLLKKITSNESIETMPLLDYFSFINYIKQAKFFITDGGGPQEESYYLGTPCLILRDTSERLWENNFLSGFNESKISEFLNDPEKYRSKPITDNYSPSKIIVDILEKLGYVE